MDAPVTVRLYATLRLSLSTDAVTVSGRTVHDAIEALCAALPGARPALFPDGGFSDRLLVLLHGRRVHPGDFARTPVEPGDVVHLFPPVGGG